MYYPEFSLLTGKKVFCCKGYCIDLLQSLSEHCNFTFSLHLSFNEYGALERNNLTGKQEWSGLIGELVREKADLIVAPLTINPERAQVMEFSKPFKYQGITILQKRVSFILYQHAVFTPCFPSNSNQERHNWSHFSNLSNLLCGFWSWFLFTSWLSASTCWTGFHRSDDSMHTAMLKAITQRQLLQPNGKSLLI